MAVIIKRKDLVGNKTFEPPLTIGYGIDSETAPNAPMTMGYAVNPPGGRNQRHFHANTASGIYVLKGRIQMFIGPDHEKQEHILEAGDFIYIPRGEIHGGPNLSETEPVEVIFCYPDVSNKDDSGTVYMEPPWDEE